MLDLLAYDPKSPSLDRAAIGAARESARRARETLSTDMWSAINTTWRAISPRPRRAACGRTMFDWVRDRTAMIAGIADDTMPRDEGWHFYVLGRSIERADMTARLLSTTAPGRRTVGRRGRRRCARAAPTRLPAHLPRASRRDREAAEFLLLDRLVPALDGVGLREAEQCLERARTSRGHRVGFSDEALRLLGRARTELEYRPLGEILDDLPVEMERLQRTLRDAGEAIAARYFDTPSTSRWARRCRADGDAAATIVHATGYQLRDAVDAPRTTRPG